MLRKVSLKRKCVFFLLSQLLSLHLTGIFAVQVKSAFQLHMKNNHDFDLRSSIIRVHIRHFAMFQTILALENTEQWTQGNELGWFLYETPLTIHG